MPSLINSPQTVEARQQKRMLGKQNIKKPLAFTKGFQYALTENYFPANSLCSFMITFCLLMDSL